MALFNSDSHTPSRDVGRVKTILQYKSCRQLLKELNELNLSPAQEIELIVAQQKNREDLNLFYQTEVLPGTPPETLMVLAQSAVQVANKVRSLALKSVTAMSQEALPEAMQQEQAACKSLDARLARLQSSKSRSTVRQTLNLAVNLVTKGVQKGLEVGTWLTGKVMGALVALGGQFKALCVYVLKTPRAALMALMSLHALKRHMCTLLTHRMLYGHGQTVTLTEQTREITSGVWQYTKVLGPSEVARMVGSNTKTAMTSTGATVGGWVGGLVTTGLTAGTGGLGMPAALAIGAGVNALVSSAFAATGQIMEMASEQAVYNQEVKNCMTAFLAIIDVHECIDIYRQQLTLQVETTGAETKK